MTETMTDQLDDPPAKQARPRKWRTLLVEPEALLRTTLARLILLSDNFTLLGDLAAVEQTQEVCARLKPDLVLIDIDFPEAEAVNVIDVVVKELPETRVLALGNENNIRALRQLSTSLVHGYIAKQEPIDILEEAMVEVASGGTYLPAVLLRCKETQNSTTPAGTVPALTGRDLEVIRGVAQGSTSVKIAGELGLSARSIETYRSRIMKKLGVSNTAALVQYAAAQKLI